MGTVKCTATPTPTKSAYASDEIQGALSVAQSDSKAQPSMVVSRFIRMEQVEAMTGFKKSSIYNKMRDGQFPQRVVLSRNRVVFVESEVLAWLSARAAERVQA